MKKIMWRDIFVTTVQLIVASPSAWKEIAKEERSLNNFIGRFFHPFIGIIALAAFVGGLWFAHDGGLQGALKNTIVSVVAVYGGFYIVSYALNETAHRFGISGNVTVYRIFTGYASVVMYLLYVVISFLADFFILWLLALYTFYIVQTGATYYLRVPTGKRFSFTLFASALIILTPALIKGVFTFLMK
ncbi:MAG TPA: hypothetical protein DCS09_10495 [Porphyromonadaceae bacterium]|nr:hypothetical protein [Porphyromonadaceae bacterium]